MKHLYSFKHIAWTFLLFFGGITMSYAQEAGIPYQAYFVDNNAGYVFGEQIKNVPLANSKVLLSFEVRDENGQVEYIEHIEVPTDQYGMASTIVGVGIGTPQAGTQFSNVDWNGKKKMLHIDIDFSNSGNNFVEHGEMPIIDIPGPAEDATTGLATAVGPPTATNPADPNAGDLYVDEATGDIYTYNGTTWVAAGSGGGPLVSGGTGAPNSTSPANPNAGDIYIDESTGEVYTYNSTTGTWENQSDVVSVDTNNIITEDAKGLAFLDKAILEKATGTSSGTGAPNSTSPANPNAGDIYIGESTGEVYTYNSTTGTWENQSDVVSADTGNIITEDAKGLAFLDKATLEKATGTSSGTGAPTVDPTNPPAPGDLYVDEATGHVYTFNGTTNAWESQHETLTSLALETNDNGSPTDTSDDYDQLVYTNENKVKNSIDIGALVKANNGLSVVAGTVELGGTLTKPTTITTSATNTLTITGLPEETAFNPNEDQVVVLDQPSGVLKRTSLAALSVQKEKVWVAANDGDTDFDTPLTITSIEKINVFRNGARVGFTAVDTDTIKLENEATCYKGDEIRIVQLQ